MWIWITGGVLLAAFLSFLAVVEILLVAGYWCSRSDNGHREG